MLSSCRWHSIYNLITEQSITLIHKIVTDKQPQSLADLMTSSMHNTVGHRYARRIHMKHHALTDRLNNSLMYKALSLYRTLPQNILEMNTLTFKKEIKNHVFLTYSPDSIPERLN